MAPLSSPNLFETAMAATSTSKATYQTTSVLIIRHGERADQVPSDPWNHGPKPRPRDAPLTAEGLLQAQRVSQALDNVTAKVIYVSPLVRCLQTAAHVAKATNLPVKVVWALATPCAYFRRTLRDGKDPLIADFIEMQHVMQKIYAEIQIQGYDEDKGKDCMQALDDMIHQTAEAEASQVLIVGHCEMQARLAQLASWPQTMYLPYCGLAQFQVEGLVECPEWSLLRQPSFADGHVTPGTRIPKYTIRK